MAKEVQSIIMAILFYFNNLAISPSKTHRGANITLLMLLFLSFILFFSRNSQLLF